METITYLALLRGINVGGNNIIKMDALRALFCGLGFTQVTSYIQSGNIIFDTAEKNKTILRAKIEKELYEKLNSEISVILVTAAEAEEVIRRKPPQFGEDDENYKYDVLFLIEPLTGEEALQGFDPREGVDRIYAGSKVVYFSRLKKELTKSRLSKIVGTPLYKQISIRNWRTTAKLCALLRKK